MDVRILAYRLLALAVPKLRQGSYFPDWLLERGKRAERALTSVVATCWWESQRGEQPSSDV